MDDLTISLRPPEAPAGPLAIAVGGAAVVVEAPAGTTLGAVADAAGLRGRGAAPAIVLVDGRPTPAVTLLAEARARHGSVLAAPPPVAPEHRPAVVELRWTDGPDAGVVDRLGAGSWVVGRAPGADVVRRDPSVRPHHAVLDVSPAGDVTLTDLATGEIAIVDARLLVGGCSAEVRPAAPIASGSALPGRGSDAWTVPVVRPRRLVPDPPAPAPVAPNGHAAEPSGGGPPLVPALVSLAGGVALAALTRQPLVLLLGGLAAVASVATWAVHRIRRLARGRRRRREEAAALAEHRALVVAWEAAEVSRAHRRHPDLASLAERIRAGGPELWAWWVGVAGLEVVVGANPVGANPVRRRDAARLPIATTVARGAALVVAGRDEDVDAVVRAILLRVVADHGPADLRVVVCTVRPARWGWIGWLPHAGGPLAGEIVGPDQLEALPGPPTRRPGDRARVDERFTLLVVDDPAFVQRRASPARRWLDEGAAAIVVARDPGAVPAICAERFDVEGRAGVLHRGGRIDHSGRDRRCFRRDAVALARVLAGRSDPEAAERDDQGLPDAVDLEALLAVPAPHRCAPAEAVSAAWRRHEGADALRVPIGIGRDGVVEVDLVADGPHALVAGTTGSGKSELLRSLVVGLAARYSPSDVAFLLVDYKGGSAFDGCTRLPHVVGVVTNLDEHLAARALRSLDAELRRREEVLRDAGVADLTAYRAMPAAPLAAGGSPADLPRLVVVIDEFATLAAELPGFLRAIVGVAQRGRSLGVHLVLATQRPGAAVSDDIRANTNLRIALRVQTAPESVDVVGVGVAAQLDRRRPGRAVVRIGADEPVVVQAAQVSRYPMVGSDRAVRVLPWSHGRAVAPPTSVGPALAGASAGGRADQGLAAVVGRIVRATASWPGRLPARPWLDPLPDHVALTDLGPGCVAIVDDPDCPSQETVGWRLEGGHLLLVGAAGSGTTTALAALGLDLARTRGPDELHVLVADLGDGALAPLHALAPVDAVVSVGEAERLERLVVVLQRELDRRRASTSAGTGDEPWLVVLVDGAGTWRSLLDDVGGYELVDALDRVVAEGPSQRIVLAMTVDRAGAVPAAWVASIRQRWIFEPADASELVVAGIRPASAPRWVPGRMVVSSSRLEGQLGHPGPLEDAVRRASTPPATARRRSAALAVDPLPDLVELAALPEPLPGTAPWAFVAIARRDHDLAPVGARFGGSPFLVAGPPRSGRTTAIASLAVQVRRWRPDAWVGLVAPRHGGCAFPAAIDACGRDLAALGELPIGQRPVLVLVDDAELVDDPSGVLTRLATSATTESWVVAAGSADALRGGYGHWTRAVRQQRTGLLLRPDPLVDGDLLGITLPRSRRPFRQPGRGFLVVDGMAELVQVAVPPPCPAEGMARSARPRGTDPHGAPDEGSVRSAR